MDGAKTRADRIAAAQNCDWHQVVCNGGPPCFYIEDGAFCFRAERWQGHGSQHEYVSLAAILREAQPAPVVGDDDAALLAKTQDWLCHNLTVTPDSHYRNVQALLERCSAALADVAREREANAVLKDTVISMGRATNEASAALATAEEAQAKAVDEEREACLSDIRAQAPPRDVRTVATEAQVSVLNHAIAAIRARAGRHHAG